MSLGYNELTQNMLNFFWEIQKYLFIFYSFSALAWLGGWWGWNSYGWKIVWPICNSLAPGKFEWNFMCLIFQKISVIDGCVISYELALRWMSLDLTDNKSTLVQVMAWCRQATSYCLSQCWPRPLSPYGVTRPNELTHHGNRQGRHWLR